MPEERVTRSDEVTLAGHEERIGFSGLGLSATWIVCIVVDFESYLPRNDSVAVDVGASVERLSAHIHYQFRVSKNCMCLACGPVSVHCS